MSEIVKWVIIGALSTVVFVFVGLILSHYGII